MPLVSSGGTRFCCWGGSARTILDHGDDLRQRVLRRIFQSELADGVFQRKERRDGRKIDNIDEKRPGLERRKAEKADRKCHLRQEENSPGNRHMTSIPLKLPGDVLSMEPMSHLGHEWRPFRAQGHCKCRRQTGVEKPVSQCGCEDDPDLANAEQT